MTIPTILMIDDQFGSPHGQPDREELLDDLNAVEIKGDDAIDASAKENPALAITFCRGQVVQDQVVHNDFECIREAVRAGDHREPWALVLLDVVFPSGQKREDGVVQGGQPGDDTFGEEIRGRLLEEFPDLPIVMLTSKHASELEDENVPYLSKADLSAKNRLTSKLLEHGRLDNTQVRHLLQLPDDVTVNSQMMTRVFKEAFDCALSDATVLLLGESGVGKEVVAQHISRISKQDRPGKFIARNIASFAENLIESELFGSEKGAYTDAKETRKGVFELAHQGTLLLDEIGDLAPSVQTKLLRAVEEGEIQRVGGISSIPVNVRLISATSKDLPTLAGGVFRKDLYYRINTVTITVPPLRDRQEDILPLAKLFMTQFGEEYTTSGIKLSEEAERLLKKFSWPGNVRQLRNIIEKLVIYQGSNTVVSAEAITKLLSHEPSSGTATGQSAATAALTLKKFDEQLAAISIDADDGNLRGAVKRIEKAVTALKKRVTGAALHLSRDKRRGQKTDAIRLIQDDQTLEQSDISREINRILDRPARRVTDEDLENLIKDWQDGPGGSDRS